MGHFQSSSVKTGEFRLKMDLLRLEIVYFWLKMDRFRLEPGYFRPKIDSFWLEMSFFGLKWVIFQPKLLIFCKMNKDVKIIFMIFYLK